MRGIPVLYQERENFVLQQLQLQSTVKVSELSRQLHISVDTVRRDLKLMEQSGLIRCVRGGACLPESRVLFSDFTGREIIHSDLKREAARKALSYVKEKDVVALNSGTTNTIVAQEMVAAGLRCTVVTNNWAALNVLIQSPTIRVIAVGGMLDTEERSTYGSICEQNFGQFYPDVVLLSINAINYKDGFTDFRMNEVGVIQLLAAQGRQVVAVMDSSKLGQCSKRKVLAPEQVDFVVMDDHVSPEIREKYQKKGIRIL